MNEIEKKEVEVIAKFLSSHCTQNSCVNVDDCYLCQAMSFYKAGYRNCKDKVVLDLEEWFTVHNDYAKALYLVRKETAREILKSFDYCNDTNFYDVYIKLCKQYEV